LNISEGKPSLIKKFDIVGNSLFDNEELLDLFDIGTPDYFFINYFTKRDQFVRSSFMAGLESIKSKYLESGFLDVDVKGKVLNVDDKNTSLSLIVEINEGEQYFIEDFEWSGDIGNLDNKLLEKLLDIKKGSVFSRSEIVKGTNRIKTLFSDKGYAKTTITTKIQPSLKTNHFKLLINVKKDSIMFINRINIFGNTITQDDVIRRELSLLEGQEFSQKELDDSIQRIKRLGFFSDVKVSTRQSENSLDKFDIFINVEETKTGEFSIGLSHANSTGPSFNTGIQQKNIFGTGNIFNATLVNSNAIEELSFYFKNPYFTNDGKSISFGVFNKTTDAANLDISDYILDESGFKIGYGIPLTKNSNLFGESHFSDIKIQCSDKFAGELYEQQQCSSNNSLDFTLNLDYIDNTLNDFFSPTKGYKQTLSSSLALPLADFQYYKLESRNISYKPVLKDSTISTKFNLQLAQGYGGKELPFFKRYFGGGASSVRGFDFNSLGSKYPDLNSKGGEVSILSSAALITPAKNIGVDNENIRVSAFMDAGSIYEKLNDFDVADIRVSSGLAASWLTPIGPIGIFVAKPLIKKSNDATETFSFQLGANF